MPTKGKLISDYTSQEWTRYRQKLIKPDLVYCITIILLALLLLLSGLGRISIENHRLDGILRIAGGIIVLILLAAYAIRRTKRRTGQ